MPNGSKISKFCKFLAGSFSAVWIATIASEVTFYSIFQALQDKQTFAPFTFQNFSENLPEFHRNCQETTKCTEILRRSVTKIRKMLEISGICEKISFFISFFHSCPYCTRTQAR